MNPVCMRLDILGLTITLDADRLIDYWKQEKNKVQACAGLVQLIP